MYLTYVNQRTISVRDVALNIHRIFKRLAKALIRLHVCAGWSEPLLVAHTTWLLEISCGGSNISEMSHSQKFSLIISLVTYEGSDPSTAYCLQRDSATPGRLQSKMLLTIDERWPKFTRNSVFEWRQMAIKNSVTNDFWSTFVDSIKVFDCSLPGVFTIYLPDALIGIILLQIKSMREDEGSIVLNIQLFNSACWVIFPLFVVICLLFLKLFFQKIISGTLSAGI